MGGTYSLAYRDVLEILRIVGGPGGRTLVLEIGDFTLVARTPGSGDDRSHREVVTVRAPTVGVFRRAGTSVMSSVEPEDVIAIVDVLGAATEIRAGCCGRVTAVLVEDGAFVEYAQPLITIEVVA